LNEHIVGRGFPDADGRQELLVEALEIIRLLWKGGYRSYEGRHLRLSDARVFDLPDPLPPIVVAAGGPRAARLAAEYGDGLFTTEPKTGLVEAYRKAGGSGPMYAEMAVSWAPDEKTAVHAAWETTRWAVTGWKVMSELPNPVNFEAASATVREEDIAKQFACGPDVERYLEVARPYVEAGFDHLVLMNAGPDPEGFLGFFESELAPALRGLA
ncbi:MAG TPA: TIGR03557 family F420-dependent LLM class oxidoreductase, partial [Phytomonospora sp.]